MSVMLPVTKAFTGLSIRAKMVRGDVP